MLRGEALREFDKLANHNAGTNNTHLKFIQETLLKYFPLMNALFKQKRAMQKAMRKPQDLPFKPLTACFTQLNNYPPLFLESKSNKRIPPDNLNNILLHAVPNSWGKQDIYRAGTLKWRSKKLCANYSK